MKTQVRGLVCLDSRIHTQQRVPSRWRHFTCVIPERTTDEKGRHPVPWRQALTSRCRGNHFGNRRTCLYSYTLLLLKSGLRSSLSLPRPNRSTTVLNPSNGTGFVHPAQQARLRWQSWCLEVPRSYIRPFEPQEPAICLARKTFSFPCSSHPINRASQS